MICLGVGLAEEDGSLGPVADQRSQFGVLN